MTYALAWPLQEAVFSRLTADPGVTALLGDRIYDAGPQTDGPLSAEGPFATLGDETAEDWGTQTDRGAAHVLRVTVTAATPGFQLAKRAAGAICDALLDADLPMARGRVIFAGFVDAKTERAEADALRRIVLRFRLLIEDTA
ncbi:MAG: DUF3168 domain-containing protein [Paracoccaceae bacterium]